MESLNQCRRLEVPVRLSDHKVLHNIASSSSFFSISHGFSRLFARISYFKRLEFKEFNRIIIPFALVGYETGYSQLRASLAIYHLISNARLWSNCYIYLTVILRGRRPSWLLSAHIRQVREE